MPSRSSGATESRPGLKASDTRHASACFEEQPDATIEDAGLAAASPIALTGAGYQEAVQTLRAMAERANQAARERSVRLVGALVGHGEKRHARVEMDVAVHTAE